MTCRKDVKDLSPAEKAAFVQALIDLKNAPSQIAAAQSAGGQGRYDDYVWMHTQVLGGAHNAPAFVPWHREFLYQFEHDLQSVSGNPDLRIPYWDWTKARTPADAGWPFTNDFMGGFGTSASDSRVTTGRFATDPANPAATEWRINIPDLETENYLKRRGIAEEFSLPELSLAQMAMDIAVFDVAPFVIPAGTNPTNAQLLASFRKFLEFVLHNGPHPWVGLLPQFNAFGNVTNLSVVGSMSWQASPNDPTFWLHHCNVDRLWALWQQRHDYPGYVPQTGGPALQNGSQVMAVFNDASYFNAPQHATPNANEDHRALGYLYASDLPEISAPFSPSLGFGNVPQGLTTYRPVQFTVTSCRPVKFRISAIGGAGFSDPYPGAHTIHPPQEGDPFTADVYVAYEAPIGGGGPAAGSVTIEAFIEDPDRLYVPVAAGDDEFLIDSWTISLSATVVPRERAAVALALDRSGSMSAAAGGGLSRFNLLEGAVEVVSDLMRGEDGLGLVYYDHAIIRRMDITAMTAAGGKAQVAAALADATLEPAGGSTAIGSAMIEAANVLADEMALPTTPYDRFAMLVMTDGNENVTPYSNDPVVDAAVAPFASQIYAVGLGREGQVSDATLGAIANYMLITGDMDPAEREFRMTKYFVQILAGITNMAVVVDPPGELTFGTEHRIPFDLATADMEADVIVLSPLAFLIDMKLEAPDGTLLTPADPGPNGRFQRNRRDIFYRLRLPALPGRPDGTHGGRWTAVLSLSRERVKEMQRRFDNVPELLERLRSGTVPYALTVQSYSNVGMEVRLEQDGLRPGAALQLFADLFQYSVPLAGTGRVRVEVTTPAGATELVVLTERAPGRFYGTFRTTLAGLYQCRFLASGRTMEGETFTREALRSAALYRRPPVPPPAGGGARGEDDRLCRLLDCLLKEKGVQKLLEEHGIDSRHLRRCIDAICRPPTRGVRRMADENIAPAAAAGAVREVARLLEPILREPRAFEIVETPEPVPVEPPEPQKIPMNPLGGMWPMVQTEDGGFEILLKREDGTLDPPPARWRRTESPDPAPRRVFRLPDFLRRRLFGDDAAPGDNE